MPRWGVLLEDKHGLSAPRMERIVDPSLDRMLAGQYVVVSSGDMKNGVALRPAHETHCAAPDTVFRAAAGHRMHRDQAGFFRTSRCVWSGRRGRDRRSSRSRFSASPTRHPGDTQQAEDRIARPARIDRAWLPGVVAGWRQEGGLSPPDGRYEAGRRFVAAASRSVGGISVAARPSGCGSAQSLRMGAQPAGKIIRIGRFRGRCAQAQSQLRRDPGVAPHRSMNAAKSRSSRSSRPSA